jgi:hypothetical protein
MREGESQKNKRQRGRTEECETEGERQENERGAEPEECETKGKRQRNEGQRDRYRGMWDKREETEEWGTEGQRQRNESQEAQRQRNERQSGREKGRGNTKTRWAAGGAGYLGDGEAGEEALEELTLAAVLAGTDGGQPAPQLALGGTGGTDVQDVLSS